LQTQLTTHLAAQDITKITKIWETLDQFPQTQRWRDRYFDPTVRRTRSQLAGDMVPQPSGIIYACPHCDYRDVVFLLGMTPDPCPNHHHPEAMLYCV
jgi:hypothetical protein